MGSLYGRDRGVLRRFRRVLRAAFVGPSGFARYARLGARPLWEHPKYPPKYTLWCMTAEVATILNLKKVKGRPAPHNLKF